MSNYYTADWIFPVCTAPLKNGVVEVSEAGEIIRVLSREEAGLLQIDSLIQLNGALVPGFINTHCHLELSHMLGKIREKTGLVTFVQSIIKSRAADPQEIAEAMEKADRAMFDNGIVAVGDISNQIASKTIKQKSKIQYHTFIEAMGFNPERAAIILDSAKSLKKEFEPLPASVVPHAPYSVSAELLKLIDYYAGQESNFISIHNQETPDENSFFKDKTGDFLSLYEFLGLDISFFQPTGKSSLQSWLPAIGKQKMLLVHNTVTDQADLEFARQQPADLFWCLCPEANLYIENALPDVDLLRKEGLKITLGTDSLASNHQLNVLKEMQTLQRHKQVPFEDLLKWATWNGAEFLGLSNRFGSIEAGKTPGLNLIQLSGDFRIESDHVKKIL